MIELRPAAERGHADHGWLRTAHSFSFADYYDPAHMGFGPLRVINEDYIAPGTGFGMHAHRDMEILTYVLSGALAHRDSLGNGSIIEPGNVQRMSAGTGVRHSEFNPSETETTHLLQIWIEPDRRGIEPGYEERRFDAASKRGVLRLIASPDGRDGSATIHQDAYVYASLLDGDERAEHPLAPGRRAYVHVARGALKVNGYRLDHGDALKLHDVDRIVMEEAADAEVLLFDLP
ncbi:MAG: pirin family protein [Pseudomonadota bacterium]|nr:MAG: quercetin 2,3-dioxygenase [Pseudomonadota bacterium]